MREMKTGVSNLDLTAKNSEIEISRSSFTWEILRQEKGRKNSVRPRYVISK